jgi:hypothetical protein
MMASIVPWLICEERHSQPEICSAPTEAAPLKGDETGVFGARAAAGERAGDQTAE